jgi:hypothetical protein
MQDMKIKKNIAAIILASALIVSLSACTPPKPPELLAQEAEQTHTCVDGASKVAFEPSLDSVVSGWQDALTGACAGMSIAVATAKDKPDLVISSGTPDAATCTPLVSAPFAIDAGLVIAYFADGTQLQLSAKSLGGILSGSITSWDDPQIHKDNPSLTLSAQRIVVSPEADANALQSVVDWMKRLYPGFSNTKIKGTPGFALDTTTLVDGSVAIMTYSAATTAGVTGASIVTGSDPLKDVVTPGNDNIKSAASQYDVKHTAVGTEVTLNPSKIPTPPLGADVAPLPYQAVFTVNLTICGAENLTNRAVAKFLLRQDQQGAIASSSVLSLPETVRVESLIDVSKGLPSPKPATN